ncbi:MAG: DUF5801 repeats-in-toxin domain-containing protein, partial [Aquiluna sp.]
NATASCGSGGTGGGGGESHHSGGTTPTGSGLPGGISGGATPRPDGQPNLLIIGQPQSLLVDETDLKTDAVSDFGKFFNVNYGPDGQGSGGLSFKRGIPMPGIDSGLIDPATKEHVLLFQSPDGTVIGRTPGGLDVFRITVNQQGHVGLDQLRPLIHPDHGNPDESETLAAPFMVTLTGTVIDANGSKASAGLAIGQMLHFKDDGPTLELKEGGHPPIITVDESFIGKPGGTGAADFSTAFAASHSAGSDGEKSFSSSYQLNTKDGTDSGLIDSVTGKAILLYKDPNTGHIVGRVGDKTGAKALEVTVEQSGQVKFTTLRSVLHRDSTDPNDSKELTSGSITLERTDTVADKDGDSKTVSAKIDIGQSLSIKDDAPSIDPPQLTKNTVDLAVLEASGANSSSGNFSSLFSHSLPTGVDQNLQVDTSFSLSTTNGTDSGLVDNQGHSIYLFNDGHGGIYGVAMDHTPGPNEIPTANTQHALDLTVAHSGQVTFSSNTPIHHGPGSIGTGNSLSLNPGSVTLQCTDTVTDADGDHKSSTSGSTDLSSHLSITDTQPSIDPPQLTKNTVDLAVL